jgi:isocitrate dehydrogenase
LVGFKSVIPRGIVEGHRTPKCVKWESSIKYFIISTREALKINCKNGIIHPENGVFMDWAQVLVIVFGNLAIILPLWLWARSETRADIRQIQEVQREDRKDILELIRSIDSEMKDFHYRLLEIERSRKV